LSSDQTPAIIAGRVSSCHQINLTKPSAPLKKIFFYLIIIGNKWWFRIDPTNY
jgi:hypothetical protein